LPTSDHEDELLEVLADIKRHLVKRLPVRDSPHIPSENLILTFSEEITDRVFVAAMSYRVQVYPLLLKMQEVSQIRPHHLEMRIVFNELQEL
jgi:hypothetical protein